MNFIMKHPDVFPHLLFIMISIFDGASACLSYSLGTISNNETISYIGVLLFRLWCRLLSGFFRADNQLLLR